MLIHGWTKDSEHRLWGKLLHHIDNVEHAQPKEGEDQQALELNYSQQREDIVNCLFAFRGSRPIFLLSTRYDPDGPSWSAALCAKRIVETHQAGHALAKLLDLRGPSPCYNPNTDNINYAINGTSAREREEEERQRDARWLLIWQSFAICAERSGGCLIQIIDRELGPSSMQAAEAEYAQRLNLRVVAMHIEEVIEGVILHGPDWPGNPTLPTGDPVPTRPNEGTSEDVGSPMIDMLASVSDTAFDAARQLSESVSDTAKQVSDRAKERLAQVLAQLLPQTQRPDADSSPRVDTTDPSQQLKAAEGGQAALATSTQNTQRSSEAAEQTCNDDHLLAAIPLPRHEDVEGGGKGEEAATEGAGELDPSENPTEEPEGAIAPTAALATRSNTSRRLFQRRSKSFAMTSRSAMTFRRSPWQRETEGAVQAAALEQEANADHFDVVAVAAADPEHETNAEDVDVEAAVALAEVAALAEAEAAAAAAAAAEAEAAAAAAALAEAEAAALAAQADVEDGPLSA